LVPFIFISPAQTQSVPPYKNPNLPVEARVNDLLSRLTLEEKIGQMMNATPAIERLGVPAHDYWNEALHGVARSGIATVFPQAIGLAATWDTELMYQVADVISTEARAKHHEYARNKQFGRYQGLTFWSPNINIFRDPRWGRGQETYGEDPYLTGELGVQFVRGLQGNDPRYFKVIATPKHYAVHSGPEPERHAFDAIAYERDLRETYLPAFRATILDGKAYSVMCAYNRTNGEPCCANKRLMKDILRGEWGFDGFVVSDCGAIYDIWKFHKFVPTELEASVLGVKAGTDLTCGDEYKTLVEAVKQGSITEAELDTSVKRLLTARFRLGQFDPPEMVAYARIPFSQNDTDEHRALALKTARESIVLLKNANRTLPLKKDLKSIAVIGPNADSPEVLWGNYNGTASRLFTPLTGIKNAVSKDTKVTYALGSTLAGEPIISVPASALTVNGTDPGLKAEYFNNQELRGPAVTVRTDPRIDFDWGRYHPTPELTGNNFSVRWTGKLTPPESGNYTLGFTADDGARLYIDGKLLVDAWASNPNKTVTKEIALEGGRSYDLRMEYFQYHRENIAKLVWSYPKLGERLLEEAVKAARESDTSVLVLGISARLEGEEMNVPLEGFRGGDRTEISLPKSQEALLKAVVATGKPVVVVLLSGSALAVNWANANVPAMLAAWYPGGEGGTAIADVLFGNYNPGGRLPVTFYKSVDQLPPFENYSMQDRTYRYFKGEPLYPFGYGLSYTNFLYSNLKIPKSVKAGEPVKVSVDVTNTGEREGDEVVQLYLTDTTASAPVPIRALVGFDRITLRPRKKGSVTFTITPRQMSLIDDKGKRVIEPGEFSISIGGLNSRFTTSGGVLELSER
jgi:beta-glucosidase